MTRYLLAAVLLSGCAADAVLCGSAIPEWANQAERLCAAEKGRGIENGPGCSAYQRYINAVSEKCDDRPKRSADQKQIPPLRGASE